MPAPIPIWWDVLNASSTLTWNCGTVDAGSTTTEKEFLIWNNKGGVSDVSDMTSVFLTTKDSSGNDAGPIAGSSPIAAVEASCHNGRTNSWTTFKEVRGSDPANQLILFNDSASTTVLQDTIKGTANDGNENTIDSKLNYSRIKLRFHVFEGAPAGPISWKTRVSYQYT